MFQMFIIELTHFAKSATSSLELVTVYTASSIIMSGIKYERHENDVTDALTVISLL